MWRGMLSWACLVAVSGLGCTKPNPRNCSDGVCEDPAFPFCDTDGSFEGTPGTCIAVECVPQTFVACRGDEAISCSGDGQTYETTTCEAGCSEANSGCNSCTEDRCVAGGLAHCVDGILAAPELCLAGCVESPAAHCAYLEPRYAPNICDQPAVTDFVLDNSGSLDTQFDMNCNGGIVAQAGAGDLCVMRYRTIKISSGATLHVLGGTNPDVGGGRALALVADDSLLIEGTLDISATGIRSGPGGAETGMAEPPMAGNGQGGAGFRTAGGPGGSPTTDGGASDGGPATANPATLAVLAGGPRRIGGGGGAATLISCRGAVRVPGIIDAGGGGATHFFVAGGGGAGGYVVLQGLGIVVTGQVFANGGGGAAGFGPAQGVAPAGEDGQPYDRAASGGYSQEGGGNGGAGAWRSAGPRPGSAPTTGGGRGGGGGGSMGYFQTYTPTGIEPTLTPAVASPPFEMNENVPTR